MNPEMETRSLTSSSVGLVTEGSGKRAKSFKRRVWASTIAALLAVGLSACDADSLKNALGGGESSSTSTSQEESAGQSQGDDSQSSTSAPSSGMEKPDDSSDKSDTGSAESGTDVEGMGDGSTKLKPSNPENEKIYRNSQGWEFLENSALIAPGARFLVKGADDSTSSCSFAWWVYNKDEPRRHYITSAGHCGNKGDNVYVEDEKGKFYKVGQFVWRSYDPEAKNNRTDHALIELTVNPKNVYGTPMLKGAELAGWASPQWLEQEQPRICRLGYRSGLSCGPYKETVGSYMFGFGNISDHGDSGGAVWAVDPENPNRIYAVGMTSYGFSHDAISNGAAALSPLIKQFNLTILQ